MAGGGLLYLLAELLAELGLFEPGHFPRVGVLEPGDHGVRVLLVHDDGPAEVQEIFGGGPGGFLQHRLDGGPYLGVVERGLSGGLGFFQRGKLGLGVQPAHLRELLLAALALGHSLGRRSGRDDPLLLAVRPAGGGDDRVDEIPAVVAETVIKDGFSRVAERERVSRQREVDDAERPLDDRGHEALGLRDSGGHALRHVHHQGRQVVPGDLLLRQAPGGHARLAEFLPELGRHAPGLRVRSAHLVRGERVVREVVDALNVLQHV